MCVCVCVCAAFKSRCSGAARVREACACTRAVVVLACRTQGVDGARAGAFLYLFCTHVPAHAVLLAPEAAALHVPKSASHAYSEQVGLQAASVLNVPLASTAHLPVI